MPTISPSIGLLDPNLGIQNILDSGDSGHMPGARPLVSSVMREAGLEELFSPSTTDKVLEQALCPNVGDGELLRPDVFSRNLGGCLAALQDSRNPAVRAFVHDELKPLLDNAELLRAYTGLMVGG